MTAAESGRDVRARFGPLPLWVLAAGLSLAGLLTFLQHRINQDVIADRFDRQTERLADNLTNRLRSYEYGLRGTRGVIITAGEDGISQAILRRYNQSRDIDVEYPGVRGFGFIRRVPRSGKDAFLAAARRENPGFEIKYLGPMPEEHFIIQYIEPLERNRQAVGLDIASERHRWIAATRAARSGSATITGPITLLQAAQLPQRSFLILLPVYREDMPKATPAQREDAVYGWAYAPVASNEIIQALHLDERDYSLTISDVGDDGLPERFYRSPEPERGLMPGLHRQIRRDVLGRHWLIDVRARESMTADLNLQPPWRIFAYGVLASLLLSALSYTLTLMRQRERREFAQRARHSALVENAVDAIIGEDFDGRVTSWNPAAERLFGYTGSEAVGRRVVELIVPEELEPEERRILQDATAGRKVPPFESIRRHKDGSRIDVSIAAVPLFDDHGRLAELAKTIRDITALKNAERDLRSLNASLEQQVADRTATLKHESERLENILSGTNVGTWELEVQTGALEINERWAEMLGYTRQELLPVSISSWERMLHPDDAERAKEMLQRHFRGELPFYELEIRMRHRDGHWVWVVTRGKVSARTADGRPEWMHGMHLDVSKTHVLLDRLHANEELLETIGAMAGTGGWEWDLQSGQLFWTQGCKKIHDVAPDYRPVLETAFGFYPPEARALLREAADAAIAEGRGYDLELPFVSAKGRALWVRVIGRAETENGRVFRLIGAIQDVTHRRDAENELVQAMRMAEAASAAKSAFLANTSHEIRTPLNAMIVLSHLLQQTRLDTEQQSLLGKIQLASRALLGVVNDVLDLSKIEAGEMAIDSVPFDLCELLREVAGLWRPQAEDKRLSLRTEMPAERHCLVLGDGPRLRQMLNNLMGNAVKFTEQGGITLSGEVLEESNDRLLVRLSVRDTGIGIAADTLPQLFTPFTQADASTTRKYGGTGLGLSIVRHLANLMGGEVGVESRPGEGSLFWVRLPLQTANRDAPNADGQPKTLAILIACADGDERNRLSAIARGLGWKAETASDAAAALVRAEAAPPVDAVLVEAGPETAETALRSLHARLPTLVFADAAHSARLARDGAMPANDGVLPSPVGSSALFNGVHSAVIRRGGDHDRLLQSTPIEATGALWLPGIKALLVDDSEINLEVAQRILEREGAVVTCAGNGEAALELLRRDRQAFDIVLMDVQMPVMDGLEATSRIRRELGLAHLPVLALTAGALIGERQRAMEAGMDDFISKPIDPRGLIQRVRLHVERVRGAALPLVLRKPAAVAGAGWPDIAGIDTAQAAARIGDDWPLFTRMLKRLLRDAMEFSVVPSPSALAEESRQRELAARLHKLRGNAGLLGAMELHRLAGEAEAHCREKRLSALRDSLERLADALGELNASAGGILAAPEPAPDAAPAPATDAATIARIRQLLASNDLEAVTLIKYEAAGLRSLIGHARYASLQDAVEELDFGKAAGLLPGH